MEKDDYERGHLFIHSTITEDHPLLMGAIEQNRQKFLVNTMGKDWCETGDGDLLVEELRYGYG